MGQPLRALIVEDSEDDALLLVRELRRGGYEPVYKRVETPEEMSAALADEVWDIVFADYVMPRFSGLDALKLMQSKGLDLPFIVVSGKIIEETAVESMRAGAHDYVMKGKLARLGPAVERELRDAEMRHRRRQAELALRESEQKYRALIECANDAVYIQEIKEDGVPGPFIEVNEVACRQLGYTREELTKLNPTAIDDPHYKERVAEAMDRLLADGSAVYETSHITKDGRSIPVEVSARIVEFKGTCLLFSIVRDISERIRAEEHKREFYRSTILAATRGKLLLCEREDIERVAGAPLLAFTINGAEDFRNIRIAVVDTATKAGMGEIRVSDFCVSVGEAVTNTIKHAGGGTASIHSLPGALLCVISDKGAGIDAMTIPEVALVRGYTTAGTLGMGYKIIISVADKVYLATGPEGTTVGIEFRILPSETAQDASTSL